MRAVEVLQHAEGILGQGGEEGHTVQHATRQLQQRESGAVKDGRANEVEQQRESTATELGVELVLARAGQGG